MDKTHLFKVGVLTVKRQRKNDLLSEKTKTQPKPNSASAVRDEFGRQAKDAVVKITALRNFLLENRTAYMRIGQHLKSATQMTDEQRDIIDRESEKFFIFYSQHLAKLRTEWKNKKRKQQHYQHVDGVLELLSNYLRSVQQIFFEQKKYRAQHELETYRLVKLAADKKKIPVTPAGANTEKSPASVSGSVASSDGDDDILVLHSSKDNDSNDNNSDGYSSDMDLSDGWQISKDDEIDSNLQKKSKVDLLNRSSTSAKSLQNKISQKVAIDEDIQKSEIDEEESKAAEKLSPEDVQMFEEENVQLYVELQGLHEDVEQIEKNVVDIAQLQDIFTEKVALQQFNIERIANLVVGATENVKDANEQIRQAIQRNAGLRVWSLFFLLVMSFALLFLDWYYD